MSHPDVADDEEQQRQEYERRWAQLSAFQRDILAEVANYNGAPHGLAIIDELSAFYDEEINHGRLYPNLDELVDADLLDKSERDKRTNAYALTSEGQAVLSSGADRLDRQRSTPRHLRLSAILGSDMYE